MVLPVAKFVFVLFIVYFAFCSLQIQALQDSEYSIGTAIADVTGPSAEVGFMGYAMLAQRGHGIHYRLRARTFIVKHLLSNTNFVYINLDLGMTMQSMKVRVVQTLKQKYPELYALYNDENIVMSATHTHSGPGAFSYYILYDITTLGFNKYHLEVIVESIVRSIKTAHENLSQSGSILVNSDLLYDTSINRSPAAYERNPLSERQQYENVGGDTDKLMTILKFMNEKQQPLGMLSVYAVHCTSMNNTNLLISGDNKGYASLLFEKAMNNYTLPGKGKFVAAFANSNEGDVSPNTMGPSCPDGTPCDYLHSTCKGKNEGCIARGPSYTSGKWDMEEATQIIGTNQFKKALDLFTSATNALSGPIEYRYTYIDMKNMTISKQYTGTGEDGTACKAAVGYSFAAGTVDGPGAFDFIQDPFNATYNPFWKYLTNFIVKPSPQQEKCHSPKPIFLDVGEAKPAEWVPSVLPIQLIKIGRKFVIVAVPGEFTTMAGRRLRNQVKSTLLQYNKIDQDAHVVLAGLANTYSGYITTFEEYQLQRYEAASTLYGPHTLAAYMQEFDKLAIAMGRGEPVPPSKVSPRNSTEISSFAPGVIEDTHPIGKPFGTILADVQSKYYLGETVSVEFWSAHPNNNYRTEDSFLVVERLQSDGKWITVATDGDWTTKFRWHRRGIAESSVKIEWNTDSTHITDPFQFQEGKYRIRHFGTAKSLFGKLTDFEGVSSVFQLVSKSLKK